LSFYPSYDRRILEQSVHSESFNQAVNTSWVNVLMDDDVAERNDA